MNLKNIIISILILILVFSVGVSVGMAISGGEDIEDERKQDDTQASDTDEDSNVNEQENGEEAEMNFIEYVNRGELIEIDEESIDIEEIDVVSSDAKCEYSYGIPVIDELSDEQNEVISKVIEDEILVTSLEIEQCEERFEADMAQTNAIKELVSVDIEPGRITDKYASFKLTTYLVYPNEEGIHQGAYPNITYRAITIDFEREESIDLSSYITEENLSKLIKEVREKRLEQELSTGGPEDNEIFVRELLNNSKSLFLDENTLSVLNICMPRICSSATADISYEFFIKSDNGE